MPNTDATMQGLLQGLESAHAASFSRLWYQLYHTNMLTDPNWSDTSLIGAWRHTGDAGEAYLPYLACILLHCAAVLCLFA